MAYASQAGRARTSPSNPQAHAICDLTSLYLVTNILNNKTYVGVTSHKNLNRRMSEHAYAAGKNKLDGHFQKALRKHGRAAFKIELIKCFDTRKDAFNAEIEYIALNKPTYNSTLGGDGSRGHKSTPKVRETNTRIHSGNKYRFGKTHSNEVKSVLRENAIKNISIFQQYADMGPKKLSKPVLCVDDGLSFESASAAARHYSLAKSAVIELCLGKRCRKTVGGLRFKYKDAA